VIPKERWVTWIVCSQYRKHGIGIELYKHLCTEMHVRGIHEFYGPVDCENVASNKAHEKIKAVNMGTMIVDGRAHYLWKHLSSTWKID
jgi:L-amino acid N-acyltransferase YncA